ncbi:hypothetical protein K439DRAFT_1650959 [Ramaria rubella]|nr:hypothetical protein K439DRAFT_1650959 [Ramaria rubella]
MPALDPELQRHHSCPSEAHFSETKVFPLIHALKEDVIENIDSALSWDQLTASDVNFTIFRPLTMKYSSLKNLATVYACLVVRSHFLRLSDDSLANANLNNSRAMMCELLAIKMLRHFANNYIELVAVLTHSWDPLASAPRQVMGAVKKAMSLDDGDEICESTSALEMAISTNSKTFLSTPLTQSVVNDIYSGHIVFSTVSRHSLVADNYKQRQIEIYDFRNAPFLDHYRLRVPKYGATLEIANFALLFLFFLLCLAYRDINELTLYERVFIVFGLAFALKEYTASQEHGWRIYIANMWNVFDTSFVVVLAIYLVFRIKGLAQKDGWSNSFSFDVLACGACILFPRLAFFAVSNNVVVLALRGMIADFLFFMAIASICFSGLLFTFWELAQLTPGNSWTVTSIAWLMTQVWFGNTSLTFAEAESFHPVFGPILMVTFAALSNTLLLTILISILTNTFARIDSNATEEHLFQFTISTIEGVKSDALFSYQSPFNLLAFLILAPLSCFVSPRVLHTANVLLIRITSFPILVLIAVYERHVASGPNFRQVSTDTSRFLLHSLPRKVKNVAWLEAIVGSRTNDLYEALFDVEIPPMNLFDVLEEDDPTLLRPQQSRESFTKHRAGNLPLSRTGASTPPALRLSPSLPPSSPGLRSHSPTRQIPEPPSPLARIYARRPLSVPDVYETGLVSNESVEEMLTSMRKVERVVERFNDSSVGQLKAEMKELQERQARIESLLLTLTRGMRGDNIGTVRSSTH